MLEYPPLPPRFLQYRFQVLPQDLPWDIFKITTLYYICFSAHQLSYTPRIKSYNQIISSCDRAGSQTKGALLAWSCPFKLITKPHFPRFLSPRPLVLPPVGPEYLQKLDRRDIWALWLTVSTAEMPSTCIIAEAVNQCAHAVRHIQ